MHLTFRQLRAFGAVSRHLSFTRAAEELNLSQPAVSMPVKQLENQIGQPLFEQMGKKIYLTEAGREVYHYTKEIIGEIGNMEAALASLQGFEHGTLSISFATTAHYFAPKLLSIFYQRFPGVDIRLDVTNRETLLNQLSENMVDMVIMGQPPRGIEVEAGEFMENPLVVIAPPEHALVSEEQIDLARFEDEQFVVRETGSGTRSAIERFFHEHQVSFHPGIEMSK